MDTPGKDNSGEANVILIWLLFSWNIGTKTYRLEPASPPV
jgi:hypothetical protein